MRKFLYRLLGLGTISLCILATQSGWLKSDAKPKIQKNAANDFTFVFMTDIHIQDQNHAVEGVKQALNLANSYKPDFVLFGGDLIMDAWYQNYSRADSLYNLFQKTIKMLTCPVYYTIGNHDIWGFSKEKGVDVKHLEYGKKMFEKRIGKRYYQFDFKNFRFYVLDGIFDTQDNQLNGHVSQEQVDWLKNDLLTVPKNVPLALVCHVPLLTTLTQLEHGADAASPSYMVLDNSVEILNLFKGYNLKLVLQGHLHFYEDLFVNNIHFITGGSVAGAKWHGPENGCEEGFVVINVNDNQVAANYVDDKWVAQ